jgi:hypothetical protein
VINKGKAVLASLGGAPQGGSVQVAPPETQVSVGNGARFGFRALNPVYDKMAEELSQWANGDLSWLAVGDVPGSPMADKDKRKRNAMADVLDGKK